MGEYNSLFWHWHDHDAGVKWDAGPVTATAGDGDRISGGDRASDGESLGVCVGNLWAIVER